MDDILLPTLCRDVLAILAVAAARTWSTTRRIARSLAPVVRPPRTLRVRTDDGREYSGVLLIEANEVIFGIVICTGQAEGFRTESRAPVVTPPPRSPYVSPQREHLPSWAEDPRDADEEPPPWLRR